MSLTFEHVTLGQRVLFGTGNAAEHLAAEVARLGVSCRGDVGQWALLK
jgi:maleylacetate reductase